jgi:hypothetical protein
MDKDKVTGKLKETEGKVTGDKDRETQGKNQKDWGKSRTRPATRRTRSPSEPRKIYCSESRPPVSPAAVL